LCRLHKRDNRTKAEAVNALLVQAAQFVYQLLMDQEPRDVRLPVMVGRSDLEAIDAWRYARHIPTRAEAIRRLIELGLNAPPQKQHVEFIIKE
jgi:surfactin synthase thioesterase subunit